MGIGHGQVLFKQKCLIDHSITRGHGFDKTAAGNVALQLLGLVKKKKKDQLGTYKLKKRGEIRSN